MFTRRHLLLGAAGAVIATRALAADSTARAFVTQIYDAYKGKDAKGHPLDSDRAVRRYFEPSLAALIIKDGKEAARRNEVGALNGDPFIDAQDWEIDTFDIAVSEPAPGKAKATVKFSNGGTAKTVELDLVKIKNEWRIREIVWTHDGKRESLRGIFNP